MESEDVVFALQSPLSYALVWYAGATPECDAAHPRRLGKRSTKGRAGHP